MDLYSTNHLTGVVNSLQGIGDNTIANKFFPGEQTETSEEIHFDVEADTLGLAPFVAPTVEGKVLTEQGFTTKTFRPAYLKMKTPLSPQGALKRVMGEALTGSLSTADRQRIRVANTLMSHRKLIHNRLEIMAVEALRLGTITVTGDLYPTVTVSFGRDAALSFALGSGVKWTDTGVKPLDNLKTWANLVMTKSGSFPRDVVMDIGAWTIFSNDTDVKERLNQQRKLGDAPSMSLGSMNSTGLTFMGTVDNFNIWTYFGIYKDSSGTVTTMLPDGTVLMVGDLAGFQAFGAIQDEDAGIQALPYFSKSWVEKDPGLRLVLTQSAPLMVPYRPNASLRATVK